MGELIRKGSDILLRRPHSRRTLVWLHGLGDSADGFAPLFQTHLTLPDTDILLLTAPERAVTINGGMVMNSWYDITSLGSREINSEVHDSAARILRVLTDLPPQPLYIGGFSQGAAMSLFVGLQNQSLPIRGVVGLSGYCFSINVAEARAQTPVFLYHGLDDAVIPEAKARKSYETELSRVVKTYKTEAGLGHSVSLREIGDLQQWLLEQFAAELPQ